MKRYLTDFALGNIVGFLIAIILFSITAGIINLVNKNKEFTSYVEKNIEIQELKKDFNARSADDFLQDPDIRRAADGAKDEFIRKRDEILQRFRNSNTD